MDRKGSLDSATASGKTIILKRPKSSSRSRSASPSHISSKEKPIQSQASVGSSESLSILQVPERHTPQPTERSTTPPSPSVSVSPQLPPLYEQPLPLVIVPSVDEPSLEQEPPPQKPYPSTSPSPPTGSPSSRSPSQRVPSPPSPEPSPPPHYEPKSPQSSEPFSYVKPVSSSPPRQPSPPIEKEDDSEMTPLVSDNQSTSVQETSSFEKMAPSVRKRATKTLKFIVKHIEVARKGYDSIDAQEQKSAGKRLVQGITDPQKSIIKYPGKLEAPPMSESLKESAEMGSLMSRKFLLPGMPKIIGDVWVFIELFITLFQLFFSLVNTQYASNRLFNGIYIVLASTNTVLACIDTFLYFYELETCKFCYRKCTRRGQEDDDEDEEDNDEISKVNLCCFCPCFQTPGKWARKFNEWFELARTILGELLIYPLVVLDLFELLGGGTFHPTNSQARVSFTLFLIGSFYLVLSVYIGRTLMSIATIRSIRGLSSLTKNDSSYTRVVVRFLFHVIGQVFVHLMCVVSVGIKIWQEDSDVNGGTYVATPFLWAVIIGGWSLPFMGVVSYFVINYYWLQSFSIGLFIDMIGLLDEPGFAEIAFQGKNTMTEDANEKAQKLLQDLNYNEVKTEAKQREEATSLVAKIVYPLKVPIFLCYAILYDVMVGGFVASLLLDYDKDNNVVLIELTSGTGIATLITIALVLLSNIHSIFVINLWMFIILFALLIAIVCSPILIIIGVVTLIRRYNRKKSRDPDNTDIEEHPLTSK